MSEVATELSCHHCGTPCDDTITHEEHVFCCYGCKAVNELLSNSDLGNYYRETSLQNESVSFLKATRKYAFLDHEDIQQQLLKFRNESHAIIKFSLPGIHCSYCIYLLEHLNKLNEHIIKAEVHFVKKEITITYLHQDISLKEIAVLLSQLGYPPDISLQHLDKTRKRTKSNNIGTQIAVAGFCFGNVMLMSMPEYLDKDLLLTDNFKILFGWINLVLAVPAMFYAGRNYLINAWKGLTFGRLNIDLPIALGMITLFSRSAYEIVTLTGPGYIDSLTGLVFFLLIGKWYQGKSYQALTFDRDFSAYFPVSVTLITPEGNEVQQPLRELQKGDIIQIHNDELIPADGKLLEGNAEIDYSFVTGESLPVTSKIGSMLYAGGRQKGAEITMMIDKNIDASDLTAIWNKDSTSNDSKMHSIVDRVSQYFTLAIMAIALTTAVAWYFIDPAQIWQTVTAVLIVACPCALALVVPFALGHGTRVLGKNGYFLKDAAVIERLVQIKAIIFDKTGTLTKNANEIRYEGEPLTLKEKAILKSVLGNSAHPLSRLLYYSLPEMEKVPLTIFRENVGKGIEAEAAGIPVKIGSASMVGLPVPDQSSVSQVFIKTDNKTGVFHIPAQYREDAFDMLKRLDNYELFCLSGDNDAEKDRLSPYFKEVKFQQKPKDKLDFVEQLDTSVMMVGDGLNDAGALSKAKVGLAVTEDIHQFSPACDGIVQGEKLGMLPAVMTFSHKVFFVIYIAFALSFLYNIVGISFAVSGRLTPIISAILMPVSSVTIVGFVTLAVWYTSRLFNKPVDINQHP